jgi:signal transduction histidine kinase
MKQHSIVRRVITIVLLVEFISALCVMGLAFGYERHAHFRTFRIMLRGRADSLLGAVQDAEDKEDNVMLDGTEISLPADDIYEVKDQNGRLLGRSKNWNGDAPDLDSAPREREQVIQVGNRHYGMLILHGMRMVDPGDKGGGIPRPVTIVYGSPVAPVWRSVVREVRFYAISSLVLMIITGVVVAWLLHRELAPLSELEVAASNVSVDSWEFHTSEQVRHAKELAPLDQALKTVLARLEQSFLQQRQFVGDAAHELRTGVTVVKSSIQLLALKPRTTTEYEAGLERSLNDCLRMEEIVAKMLTLARLENNSTTSAESATCDLAQVAQQVASELSAVAALHGVEIIVDATTPAPVTLELGDTHILCSNLLLNAIQHSYSGSSVRIEVSSSQSEITLRVIDHGHGIDAAELPHIFDRFYRSDASRARTSGGTGLGLALTKAVVDRANGTIDAVSKSGEGTTMRISLPSA